MDWFKSTRLVFCTYSEKIRSNARLVFMPDHILKIALIDIRMRGKEWFMVGKGSVRDVNGVKEYVVEKLVVPKQRVTSTSVSVKLGKAVNGIVEIHRHPFNMSSFSSTDIEYFNYPVMALVYGSDEINIKAVVKQELPCGLLGAVPIDVVVRVREEYIDANKFLKNYVSDAKNIEEEYSNIPEYYAHNNRRDDYEEYLDSIDIFI